MVSRRKILSRSRDDLNLDTGPHGEEGDDGGSPIGAFRNNNFIEQEDVWFHKDKLYSDHVQEVLDKWESIDDEIWAKVIVLERNRRVAKAYARAPVLTVNGSPDGFDGFRIGLNGFDNPMRDPKVDEAKALIGQGCKVKMDATGNILVKRLSRAPVFVKNTIEENSISNDILKLPNSGLLDPPDKPFKLFDMRKFQQNVNREMKRAYPDRRKLEAQCISAVSFVKNEQDLLYSPVWIMLINVVALEMLNAKMPQGANSQSQSSQGQTVPHRGASVQNGQPNGGGQNGGARHQSEPRLKRFIPGLSGSSDEDPYSLTPSGSSGSSGKGGTAGGGKDSKTDSGNGSSPPRLPQKEKDYYGPQNWAKANRHQDYSDDMDGPDDLRTLQKKGGKVMPHQQQQQPPSRQMMMDSSNLPASAHNARSRPRLSRKQENKEKQDDPYYCGMRARVPNFVSAAANGKAGKSGPSAGGGAATGWPGYGGGGAAKENQHQMAAGVKARINSKHNAQQQQMHNSSSAPNLAQLPGAAPPFWWHSRLYPEAGPAGIPGQAGGPQPTVSQFSVNSPLAFRTSAADLSNYHYGRRGGANGPSGYQAALLNPGLGAMPHRPAVFRTGWE